MELRDIEIFLTLAEELHFGRTAQRLHVSPARVSQAIALQERRIGAALFDRSSRRVTLTPIGIQLRDSLAHGYHSIQHGLETARTAARGVAGTITVGTMGALAHEIADVTTRFRALNPQCEVQFREVRVSDPFGPLRSGEVDVAVLWLPVREPDLTVGPVVRTSPVYLMMSTDHPLARRDEVCLEDLAECVVPQSARPVPAYWEAALSPFHTPSGRPIPRGPEVATWQEVLAAVAAGSTVVPIQAEASRYYAWPGITYVPIRDAEPSQWTLIWRTAGETALIRALAEVVATC
ncbi:LysR substrate-binding domain-containing protein [Micromonospora sp. KC721]|uniref:LysR substrate-binding domain-containing protein n=1 Tax=Micromonospora sp. KC721 TaxID=2530380 RepID=UPI0010431311|nr:LysR substrate-binding domain-containing protein [Micromonospora sp. KC721]TDB73961.1 LysR family transcriptional regulator [Micromonospora sp. KC721]